MSQSQKQKRNTEYCREQREIATALGLCHYRKCKEKSKFYFCKFHREKAAEQKRKIRERERQIIKEYNAAYLYLRGYIGLTLTDKIDSLIKMMKARGNSFYASNY